MANSTLEISTLYVAYEAIGASDKKYEYDYVNLRYTMI
jgi:hypothetical protein